MAGRCGLFCWWREPARKVTLVMVGLDNAGKTAALHRMRGEPPQDVGPTAGFSKGHLKKGRFEVTIFELGGGKEIRKIWRNYYAEAHGVIFVVDSSDVTRMEEMKEAMREVLSSPRISGKPMLVLANKKDREGALSEADVIACLTLEEMVNKYKCPLKIEPCSATMGRGKKIDKSIKEGFCWLLQTIEKDFDTLNERIQRDTAQQRAYEQQQKAEGAERVRRIREEREREEGREREGDRRVPEEEDPVPGSSENLLQPTSTIIMVNEKRIEKEKEQQSLEIEEAAVVIRLQTEQEQTDAGHFPSCSSQNTNDRPDTCHPASAVLLQHEEEIAQTASVRLDSGAVRKKKSKKLRLRRGHRVEPPNTEDTVTTHLVPPPALLTKNRVLYTVPSLAVMSPVSPHFPLIAWGTPRLNRLGEREPLGEPHQDGFKGEGDKTGKPDEETSVESLCPLKICRRLHSDPHDITA
ncbi:ADP-ribosylation factor-like 13B [Eurypyga helias]|uniref:ADP-ribosylation factor-like 13B n=1 Tax=Eurypyga helias TaxID=54383 RepID=A0A093J267_EURHL|nr:ADP-ribosylation factor-like 13B [Eurypyga helias]